MPAYRIERDTLGEVHVPVDVLYGAQTQRAVNNFPVSGIRLPAAFIHTLGLIKHAAARVNASLGLLEETRAQAIAQAADEVAHGVHDAHFPIDVFQTGSATSTNMNANEVIARRAMQLRGEYPGAAPIHANDEVNLGQSSNDVIPTAMHVSAYLAVSQSLLPALRHLATTIRSRATEHSQTIKTGRTHLMDAVPLSLGQEMGGWATQVEQAAVRIEGCLTRLARLAIGGTAVGTGLNTHPEFGRRVAETLSALTGLVFVEADDHFAAQASMDTATELSGHLKTAAVALLKIANDLRWMNSGPIAGLGEVTLPALQPGSSVMPGKVNPVLCEATMMAAAQVIGNDLAITIGNQHGNFELNTMLPLMAHNLLQSITLLANVVKLLADQAIATMTVHVERMAAAVEKTPLLVTALTPVIGYDRAARIARQAAAEGRRVKDVAAEQTDLSPAELDRLLDPRPMSAGGISKA
ncbi:MAG TPA: class II fumarate hydratase [Candidatus Tectomicrobia bacterium]|jgi:fumarate hydratase class II